MAGPGSATAASRKRPRESSESIVAPAAPSNRARSDSCTSYAPDLREPVPPVKTGLSWKRPPTAEELRRASEPIPRSYFASSVPAGLARDPVKTIAELRKSNFPPCDLVVEVGRE